MDREQLYNNMTERKHSVVHHQPYNGGNGRIDRFLDLIRDGSLPRGGVALDFGGSHGDLLDLALREKLFDDGYVADISWRSVEVARGRGLKAAVMDVDSRGINFSTEFFDCVVALDVIEHLVDPVNFARECYKVLKPDGWVFINTPNISYWRHLESLVCDGHFPHTSGDREVYHGGHLAFYNENDLVEIFETAGFAGNRHTYADGQYDAPPHIWRNLLRERGAKADSMLGYPNLIWSIKKRK
jgi:2-polyprenyl-3-methyl-5-hydroxy-6-metoxy-1,4-benzoquinol methylase